MSFLLLGEPWSNREMRNALDSSTNYFIDRGIELGLLERVGFGEIALKDVRLTSRRLDERNVVYFFADFPSVAHTEKVYTSPETYFTLAKLMTISNVEGVMADMGTGSGVLPMAIALTKHGVKSAVGTDINPRALNLARFNAIINGVENKVSFCRPEEFAAVLNGRTVSLAVANPPFVLAPAVIPYNGREVPIQSILNLSEWDGPDGLEVWRHMRDTLVPHMGPDSELVVHAASAVIGGRPLIATLMDNRGCDKVRLQGMDFARNGSRYTPDQHARLIAGFAHRKDNSVSEDFLDAIYGTVRQHLAAMRVDHLVEGVFLFQWGES